MADLRKYANNYSNSLNGAITNVATTIVVNDATGLPAIGANEYYHLTISESGVGTEVVQVTDDASSPSLTVVRGADGSSSYAFSDGATVELRLTSDTFEDVLAADASPQLRGDLSLEGFSVDGGDLGANTAITSAQIDNININGNTISSTNTNGDINLTPDGSGDIYISSGNVGIGTTPPGAKLDVNGGIHADSISFDSGTNALDYYEEGTFTPVFRFATNGDLSVSYSSQFGQYVKIGKIVFVYINLIFTPTYTTSSGVAWITGLPFVADSVSFGLTTSYHTSNLAYPSGVTSMIAANAGSAAYLILRGFGSSTQTDFTTAEFTSGVARTIRFSGYYEAST